MVTFALHLASLQIDRRNYSFPFPFQETYFMLGLVGLLYSIAPSIVETSYSYTSLKPTSNNGKE
jgi:hypothetical protein